MESKSTLSYTIKTRLKQTLSYDISIPPQLFFAFFIVKEFGLLEISHKIDWLFYTGLLLFLISCFNCYLFYLGVLNNSIAIFTPFNIIIGILSSNQKYKLFLTVFTNIYYLPREPIQLQNLAIMLLCLFICFHTYNEMIFPTKNNNLWFFCGFFCKGCLEFFVIIFETFQLQFGIFEKLSVCVIMIILGRAIINKRIGHLFENSVNCKNVGIIALQINCLKEKFEEPEGVKEYWETHKYSCFNETCFCSAYPLSHTPIHSSIPPPDFIINSLFLEHFQSHSLETESRLQLIHHYICFLIDYKKYAKAMQILFDIDEKKLGFFGRCEHWRMIKKLKESVSKVNYFDKFDRKLEYIQSYDMEIGNINKEIREILEDKVEFWKELCKKNPQLKELEINGRNLVNKIENLHEVFMFKIKPCEEALSYFKCTFFYASYLILTTNYFEFANSLTKRSIKILEEKIGETGHGPEYGLFLEISSTKRNGQTKQFELVITNISSTLCALLGKEKQTLINGSLAEILPNEFKALHDAGFDNFMKNQKLTNSIVIGKTLELPFKINDNHAIFLYVSSELRFDPVTCKPTLQCMIKKITNDDVSFIVNLDGKVIYKESELFKDFCHHDAVKYALQTMKSNFERNSHLDLVETEAFEENNLIRIICSPLFSSKQILSNLEPLIRIVLKSDNFKKEKMRIDTFEISNKIKQQSTIDQEGLSQEIDSQNSNASRKDSVTNVISNLLESNALKKEPFLTLIIGILGIFSIICFIMVRDVFKTWNTSRKEDTPEYTIMTMINIKTILNLALNEKYDLNRTFADPLVKERIMYALHEGKSASLYVEDILNVYFFAERSNLYDNLFGTKNEVSYKVKELLKKEVKIANSLYLDMGSQNMSLQGGLINMIVSVFYAKSNKTFERLLLYFNYLPVFHKEFTEVINNSISSVINNISQLRKNKIVTISCVNVCLLIFLIPIIMLIWDNKRERLKIYNLFANLEVKHIIHEINKLEVIDYEIFAHATSNQNIRNESSNKVSSFGVLKRSESFINKNINSKESSNVMTKTVKDIPSVKFRKRGADLDIRDSDCDRKKVIFSDSIPIWFTLIFFALCNIVFFIKYDNINRVEDQFNKSIGVMDFVEDMSLALVNTKRYIDEYTLNNKITFNSQDLELWTRNWLLKVELHEEFKIGKEDEILNCTKKTIICNKTYSLLLLQGLIKKTISDGFEAKKAYLRNKSNENLEIVEKSREDLVYTTFLLNELATKYNEWISDNFNLFEKYQQENDTSMEIISIIYWMFLIIFFISSFAFIALRKKIYVTEVSLLSILSKEMLYNNKSVESFLKRVSKSIR